jgi:hypothetical protein
VRVNPFGKALLIADQVALVEAGLPRRADRGNAQSGEAGGQHDSAAGPQNSPEFHSYSYL